MDSKSVIWFVIINPTSGNGSGRKHWPKIKTLLERHNFGFNYAFTSHSGHSKTILHKAIKQGIKNIISVGGDGTLHHIVNGIMTQKLVPTHLINVGVIPIGTGNDWVKTHHIPSDFEQAILNIKNGCITTQDIGKITLNQNNNSPIFFNNLAGVGFDGYVVSKVEKYKHIGALAYLYGTLASLFAFKNFECTVTINSETFSGKTLMVLIGLCNYSGGGMQLTETPNPFDGLLDVTIAQDLSKADIIKNLPKLFNGTITNHKKVETIKAKRLTIEINDTNKPFIQADGELIGTGYIDVTIIENAFSFYAKKKRY